MRLLWLLAAVLFVAVSVHGTHTDYGWLPSTQDSGHSFQVFYLEHPLISNVLKDTTWTAYHAGLGFVNEKTGEALTVDYIPLKREELRYFLMPKLLPHPEASWYCQVPKEWLWWWPLQCPAEMLWQNGGVAKWEDGVGPRWVNQTFLTTVNGGMINQFVQWVTTFNATYTTFEPVNLVNMPSKTLTRVQEEQPTGDHNGADGTAQTLLASTTCHDFVESAMLALHELGASFDKAPRDVLFRDAVLVHTPVVYDVWPAEGLSAEQAWKITQWYSLYDMCIPYINKDFGALVSTLSKASSEGLFGFIYSRGRYLRVRFVAPYIDYCYVPIEFPPSSQPVSQRFSLCAMEEMRTTSHKMASLLHTPQPLVQLWEPFYTLHQRSRGDTTAQWSWGVVLQSWKSAVALLVLLFALRRLGSRCRCCRRRSSPAASSHSGVPDVPETTTTSWPSSTRVVSQASARKRHKG